jgi:hypothetical protein
LKQSIFAAPVMAIALMLTGISSLTAGLTGAIFTTVSNGSVVNANQYDSPCSVYLNGGPGPHAPATAAGLPDGNYYFQVTDPSGKTLLSTDPVSNRSFTVSGGVITAYTGTGGPVHLTGIDQDEPGAITIRLANLSCPADFAASPNNGGTYKVWVTPVASFIGDRTQVDNSCGTGCFHGFVPSATKTDNFKVDAKTPNFCLTVQKIDANSTPVPAWQFDLTDPLGTVNAYFTDSTGNLLICGLVPGAYTVSEDMGSAIIGLTVNNTILPPSTIYSFTWTAGQPAPVIIFRNGTIMLQ